MTNSKVELIRSQAHAKLILERRKRMQDAIDMFRPTVAQEVLLRMLAADVLNQATICGMNRGGKSVLVAVWFAALVLDRPITMRDGSKLYVRPERWRGQELLCWLVGFNWSHIGETLHRLLFRPGLFKIIRDKKSGQWRSYDPTNPDDKGRKNECKPSWPLITESVIVPHTRSWENKAANQVQCLTLTNGTRLVFYPSTGEVAQGNPVHVIWVDEKINNDDHYNEWLMRLVDYEGRIVWSSWPTLNPVGKFLEVQERAQEEKEAGVNPPRTINFTFRKGDNPYTDNETMAYNLSTMSDEEAAARGDGQSNLNRWLMYPSFSHHVNRTLGENADGDDALAAEIRRCNGIPPTWTRYLFLDPGHANCALLKVAIPPPRFGTIEDEHGRQISAFVIPYYEFVFHHLHANDIGKNVAAESKGEVFEDFTCDWHAYRQTPMGMAGTTIGQNYEQAFAKAGLRSQRRGATFSMGGDDTQIRANELRGLMRIVTITGRKIGPGGTDTIEAPRLRLLTTVRDGSVVHACPELVRQLNRFRKGKDADGNPTDQPSKYQKPHDLVDCLEYTAIKKDLLYVPGGGKPEPPMTLEALIKMEMKRRGIEPTKREESVYCGAGRPAA